MKKYTQSQLNKLMEVIQLVNTGVSVEEVLEYIYNGFQGMIPYDRIGLALLSEDQQEAKAHWFRANREQTGIVAGYTAPLEGSSLQDMIASGQPRIINDLEAYYQANPASQSTQNILADGICSSLTFPLFSQGRPVGFIFFSSAKKNTYTGEHSAFFEQIAAQVGSTLEKVQLIDTLKQQRDMLEQQTQELEIRNVELDAFSHTVAHDLKAPLSLVYGYLHTLIHDYNDRLTADMVKMLRVSLRSTEKMDRIIESLLMLSQMRMADERGFQLVDVDQAVQQAIDHYQYDLDSRRIRLSIADDLPSAWGNTDWIEAIFTNLIGNAIKYIGASNPDPLIVIRGEQTGDQSRYEIEDNGIGIPQDVHQKLFQEFTRFHDEQAAGYGLGLSIVRRIVTQLNGDISVESVEGQGSVFSFTLPAARPS